jgi:hypothetical protein
MNAIALACRSVTTIAVTMVLAACGPTNNPIFGRAEATVGGYDVVVTDCYTFSLPKVEKVGGGEKFAPCPDSVVTISGDSLYVNGQSYGDLERYDHVIVEHGKVKVVHSHDEP